MQVGRYSVGAMRTGFSGKLASHAPVTTQCTVFGVHPLLECVIAPKRRPSAVLLSSFRTPPLLPSSRPRTIFRSLCLIRCCSDLHSPSRKLSNEVEHIQNDVVLLPNDSFSSQAVAMPLGFTRILASFLPHISYPSICICLLHIGESVREGRFM